MFWYSFVTKYTNIVLNIFSQTGISLDVQTVSSKDYFLRRVFYIKNFFFKNTYVQGILCRYTLGCVLVGPMTDGGTI